MCELLLTFKTHHAIKKQEIFLNYLNDNPNLKVAKERDYLVIGDVAESETEFLLLYNLLRTIDRICPNEENKWRYGERDFSLKDWRFFEFMISNLARQCEKEGRNLFSEWRLNEIVKDNGIESLPQLKRKSNESFIGVYPYDGHDFISARYAKYKAENEQNDTLVYEYKNVVLYNKYIEKNIKIKNGNRFDVTFINCVITGDIVISSATKVEFVNCIFTGECDIADTPIVYCGSVNSRNIHIKNVTMTKMQIHYSKIYRFVCTNLYIEDCEIKGNEFQEYCFENVKIEGGRKFDISQFDINAISEKTVKQINRKRSVDNKLDDQYYLTFLWDTATFGVNPSEIVTETINTLLENGIVEQRSVLRSNLLYKKKLSSSRGIKRFLIYITGAFRVPSRWVIYLLVSVLLFAMLYFMIPNVTFQNNITFERERLSLLSAMLYSTGQLIGANVTNYTPIGVANLISTINVALNTMLVANLAASITKKYFDEI